MTIVGLHFNSFLRTKTTFYPWFYQWSRENLHYIQLCTSEIGPTSKDVCINNDLQLMRVAIPTETQSNHNENFKTATQMELTGVPHPTKWSQRKVWCVKTVRIGGTRMRK